MYKKYTLFETLPIIEELNKSFPASLIGSIARQGYSYNDIDILIPSLYDNKEFLVEFFKPERIEPTDWGGLFFHNTKYGNVDLFYTTEDFEY